MPSGSRRRSSATRSTPTPRCRRRYERDLGCGIGRSPGHRRLHGHTDNRDPGVFRRHRRGRRPADHARVRQADDGPRPSAGTKAADSADSAIQAEDQAAPEASQPAPQASQPTPQASQPAPPASQPAPEASKPAAAPPASAGNGGGPVYASPAVRRVARELGVDLHRVTGSGRKGRITKDDVQAFVEGGPSAARGAPAPAPGAGGGGAGAGLD